MAIMDTANVGYSYHLPAGGWNNKIRNTLSQFSDLFSEFNKYIAPAYHHDRCERYCFYKIYIFLIINTHGYYNLLIFYFFFISRSVQMRVYSMHKGEFVMSFITFFACLGLGVFIGLAG